MNLIKLILAIAYSQILFASEVVDFGTLGKTNDIIEQNGNELIQEKLKELDYKAIENQIDKKIEALKTSHEKIPTSMVDSEETKIDLYRAKWDIKDYDGTLRYKKGDYIPTKIPFGVKLEMCFVDGALNDGVLKSIVKSFGSKCTYFVNNVNFEDFSKTYSVSSYPIGGQNTEFLIRYGVKKLPTKIIRFDDKITTIQLSVKRLSLEQRGK